VRRHLDGLVAQPVQAHEMRQGRRPVRLGREPPRDGGRVDGVVEVRVPDEHAGNRPRGRDVGVEHGRVRHGRPAQQQRPQRDARHIGVDEQRHALERQPVARDAEPDDVKAGRQVERDGLQRVQGVVVG
jgi:hypothetical protein